MPEQVVATDFEPDQVAVAEERLSDLGEWVELRIVDARRMPFDDARFDALFSFSVSHQILHGWREVVAEGPVCPNQAGGSSSPTWSWRRGQVVWRDACCPGWTN